MKIGASVLAVCVAAVGLAGAITAMDTRPHSAQSALPPAPLTSAAAPRTTTYSTTFPLTENPLSEGGRWIGGKSVGLDWGDVSTDHGFALGHAGPARFADSVALLTGPWGPEQTAEAVVDKRRTFGGPEVSLRLRSSLSPHRCTGYEISWSLLKGGDAYLIIVRWNGRLADFTYLLNTQGEQYSVHTGDIVKATISGDLITAYKNGVLVGQARDRRWKTGQPGFGFNEGINGTYGISRFSASATDLPPR